MHASALDGGISEAPPAALPESPAKGAESTAPKATAAKVWRGLLFSFGAAGGPRPVHLPPVLIWALHFINHMCFSFKQTSSTSDQFHLLVHIPVLVGVKSDRPVFHFGEAAVCLRSRPADSRRLSGSPVSAPEAEER